MSIIGKPDYELQPRQVKVMYKVKAFYSHCPGCGIIRQCRREDDGTFSLICGCRRDGANRIEYLVSAEDIVVRVESRTRYLDIPDDDPCEMIEE